MSQTDAPLRRLSRAGGLLPPDPATDGELLTRFLDDRDAAAFETLLARHGPMVWGVCRRTLTDHQDAEDAFQATFLVLVRKGRAVRPRDRVGNWLHGVAGHAARKARTARARVRRREVAVTADVPAADPTDATDLAAWVDHEVGRLPVRYRAAVVACDLEGRTIQEAARHLGCPAGTVASRLARGRRMLARRLTARGLAAGAVVAAGGLGGRLAVATVPPAAALAGVRALLLDPPAAPARAASLAAGVTKMLLAQKLRGVAVGILLVLAGGLGVTGLAGWSAGPSSAPPAPRPVAGADGPGVAGRAEPAPAPRLVVAPEDVRATLSGEWIIAGAEAEGQAVPLEVMQFCTLSVDGAAGTFSRRIGAALVGGSTDRGTFQVVGSGPEGLRIDLAFTRVSGVGERPGTRTTEETARELWRLDGPDRLLVCLSEKGRPDRVATRPGDGRMVLAFERKKPGGVDPARLAAAFEGTWTESSREADGKSSAALAAVWPCSVVVRGTDFAFSESSLAHSLTESGGFKVVAVRNGAAEVDVTATRRLVTDPGKVTTTPFTRKELWRVTAAGEFQRCFPADDAGARPGGFTTAAGDGRVLLTLTTRQPPVAGEKPAELPEPYRGTWVLRLTSDDGGKTYRSGGNQPVCEVTAREVRFAAKVPYADEKLVVKAVTEEKAGGRTTHRVRFENGAVWVLSEAGGSITAVVHRADGEKLTETCRITVRKQAK